MIVRPATFADAAVIQSLAREADVQEVHAAMGSSVIESILFALDHSDFARVVEVPEGPMCIFGICPLSSLTGVGVPWLISTGVIEQYQFQFARACRPYWQEARRNYRELFNYVDERYVVSQRWLRWMGFTLEAPEPYGKSGLLFRRFWWSAESQVCVTPESM